MATSNKNFKVKNGLDVAGAATADSFVKLGGTSDEFLMADGSVSAGGGGGGSLEVSETPPSSPSEGDIWYNSQTGQTFVYYDSFWVENIAGIAGPEGPTGPIGEAGLVAQSSEPVDTSTLWLDTDEDGVGIPLGGTTGQVLAKVDSVDFNTEWVDTYTPTEIDDLLDDKANSASPTFTVPGEQVTTATVDVYGTYAGSEPSSLIFMVDQGSLLGAATVGTSVRFLQESAISQYTYTVDGKFISMPPIPNSIHVRVTSVNSTALSALIAWGDLQQQPPGNKEVSTIQESTTTISATEIGYLDGVTSSIQTQISSKAPLNSPTFTGTVSGVTKNHVGLGNVDNTSDANKPVSSATQTALDGKASLSGATFTGNIISPGINWILFSNPVVSEFLFTGAVDTSVTLNSSVPTSARYVLANVFITATASDHENFVLSATQWSSAKNWVDTRGTQPSSVFGALTQKDHVTLTYFGESDGFTSNYGIWYNSLDVPTSGRTVWVNNFGNSGTNAWMYFVIRGYSL